MSKFIELQNVEDLFEPVEFEPGVTWEFPAEFCGQEGRLGDTIAIPRIRVAITGESSEAVLAELKGRLKRMAVQLLEAVIDSRSRAEDAEFIKTLQERPEHVRVTTMPGYRVYANRFPCIMPHVGKAEVSGAADGVYALTWELGLSVVNRKLLAFEPIQPAEQEREAA